MAETLIHSSPFLVYQLAKFQVSRPYGLGCTFSFTGRIIIIIIIKILTITIGILHFVQEPLIKAASSIKRGSCFEGTRVCFYGVGQH